MNTEHKINVNESVILLLIWWGWKNLGRLGMDITLNMGGQVVIHQYGLIGNQND